MSKAAFDTLGAARKLQASGLGAEQSESIVEVVSQSTSQFVTVEHFDAGIALLHSRIDALEAEMRTRFDALQTELRTRTDAIQTGPSIRTDNARNDQRDEMAEFRRDIRVSLLVWAGAIISVTAYMLTILGIYLIRSGFPVPS